MPDDSEFFRKKPQQARSWSVVNAIIEAADQLLERAGEPQKLSLQRIAERAGVGIGSLYDYFANREGLLGAFLARLTEKNFEALERELTALGPMPFDDALPHLVDAVLRTYLERPERTRAIIRTIARLGWVRPVVAERDRFAALLAERLCADHPELDAARARLASEVLCDAVMGVVLGELWRDRDDAGAARVREELLALTRLRLSALVR